jgi:para-nitrobenzyl esterase
MSATGRICLAFVVCSALASARADEAPTVSTLDGAVRGSIENGEAVFRGIPYAAPPIGELRWREPEPAKPWNGVRAATAFGPSCMQDYDFGPMSEDCLTLNIWAPEWPSKTAKAVMVWFHGGGDTEGGSNSPYFYGDSLAKRGVVVVSVNYRLGVFGFMAHPELTQESRHHASGNYGLLDQIAALQWVRNNIGKFGGDPERVTIFGQSAGAADVERLMVSPLSKGLFQRAIAESGAARRYDPPLSQQEGECGEVAKRLNPPAKDQIAWLRKIPAHQVLSVFARAEDLCRPINLDGYVLPEQPIRVFEESRAHPVPFMLGNTLREGFDRRDVSAPELKEEIRAQYGDLAPKAYGLYGLTGAGSAAPDPLYGPPSIQWGTDQEHRCRAVVQGLAHSKVAPFYQFEFQRALPGQSVTSSTHTDEIPFVFGVMFNPRYARTFGEMDRKTADQMQRYWTNFAINGDPNAPGLPQWKKFDAGVRGYMAFGKSGAEPGAGLRREQCEIFEQAETARPTWQHPERGAKW